MTIPRRSLVFAAGLAILLVLPALASAIGEPFLVSIASRVLIYALAAVSLDLIVGYGGMVSFGHAAFLGLGAYTVGIVASHAFDGTAVPLLPFDWVGTNAAIVQWPLAMLVSALFALIIGALSLRTSGVYLIMITLAFAQMLYHLFLTLPAYGGQDGLNLWQRSQIPGLDLNDDVTFYYLTLAVLVLTLLGLARLVNSRFGMVLRAGKQNEMRLKALGIPAVRYKLLAFVIAGALGGLAGALTANHTEFVGPGLLHWTRSGELLVIVILGGLGSLYGAVVGAATLLILEGVISGWTEHWMIVLGPFLVLVVLFARRGLYGWLIGDRDD
jgi:branched-chain amino acid transport system permease protein